MKNKILIALASVVLAIVVWVTAPFFMEKETEEELLTEWEEIDTLGDTSWEYEEPQKTSQELMSEEIAAIPYDFDDMSQKMDWYKEYKNIVSKYPEELHSVTIYDIYSDYELDLLFRIVQSEVGNEYGFREKANVASAIFNRCSKGNKTLTQVLTAKGQFTPYITGSYKNVTVDEKTILACEYVFEFGDTTNGCISFRSHTSCPEKWSGWYRQFSDNAHCFYK